MLLEIRYRGGNHIDCRPCSACNPPYRGIDMFLRLLLLATAVAFVTFSPAHAKSCKAASTCKEAVEMWCNGYSGADRDNDGIPCENVCRSKKQVEAIQKQTGCGR